MIRFSLFICYVECFSETLQAANVPVLSESEHVFCLFLQVVSEQTCGWVWQLISPHHGLVRDIWGCSFHKWISVVWTTCHGICCFHLPCFDYSDCFLLCHLFSTAWSVHCTQYTVMLKYTKHTYSSYDVETLIHCTHC